MPCIKINRERENKHSVMCYLWSGSGRVSLVLIDYRFIHLVLFQNVLLKQELAYMVFMYGDANMI